MKLRLLYPILLVFFSTGHLTGQTLHLLKVIQESAKGSVEDSKAIDREMAEIKRYTSLQVRSYEFDRYDGDIVDAIRQLQVGQEDVIWFYYSGHGSNAGDGYPKFSNEEWAFPLTKVHEILKDKGPRLCITTYDCCNIGVTTESSPYREGVTGLALREPDLGRNYRLLFECTFGDLLMASCTDERYSFGSNEFGGFFTSSLFNGMRTIDPQSEEYMENIWENLLQDTRRNTNRLCRQHDKREQDPKYSGRLYTDIDRLGASAESGGNFLEIFLEEATTMINAVFREFTSE